EDPQPHLNLAATVVAGLNKFGKFDQGLGYAFFYYVYSIAHSPRYRDRYADFLFRDFPRIPLPGSRGLFEALVPLGERLVALHLMEADVAREAAFAGKGDRVVGKVTYDEARQAVF